MKILFISNDPTIFDTTSAAYARMHAYAVAIGELHIVSPAKQGTKGGQSGNLFLYPVSSSKLFRVWRLASRARAVVRAEEIEVVSAQDPFELGLAALRAVKGTSAKLHIQVHTDFLSPWFLKSGHWRMTLLNRYRVRIANRVLPKAAGIRVVSERIKESLVAKYGSRISEPTVIPIAVEIAAPLPEPLPKHPFTFALIAVGRLEPEKRVQDILTALSLVYTQYPMVGLFVVGDGRERKNLEKKTCTLGLENRVVFLGERSDARALIASAQAFIQASAYEGYGRTLIEAALANTPIITTDVGIVGSILKNEEDVFAVPVASPVSLAKSIVKLIEDVEAHGRLQLHAALAAQAHLTAVGDLPTRIATDLSRLIEGNVS